MHNAYLIFLDDLGKYRGALESSGQKTSHYLSGVLKVYFLRRFGIAKLLA